MQLKATIAAVVGAIVILFGVTIWWLKKDNDTLRDTIGIQKASIVSLEASIQYQKESARKSQEHRDELDRLRQANAASIERVSNELAMEKEKNFSLAQKLPFDAGNNITRWLSWWMCENERSGSSDSGTCDIHAPVSEEAAVNFAQAITPEVGRQRQELCEAGQRDYCDYVMVAFSWQGWHNFQNYLMKDLLATQALYANDQYFRSLLEKEKK